jgi:hypothetical protein
MVPITVDFSEDEGIFTLSQDPFDPVLSSVPQLLDGSSK